jgi:predicted PurR-regulated permease PerM
VRPLAYGRTSEVNPLVTIASLLTGAAGNVGGLLAIPSAAAIQGVLRDSGPPMV